MMNMNSAYKHTEYATANTNNFQTRSSLWDVAKKRLLAMKLSSSKAIFRRRLSGKAKKEQNLAGPGADDKTEHAEGTIQLGPEMYLSEFGRLVCGTPHEEQLPVPSPTSPPIALAMNDSEASLFVLSNNHPEEVGESDFDELESESTCALTATSTTESHEEQDEYRGRTQYRQNHPHKLISRGPGPSYTKHYTVALRGLTPSPNRSTGPDTLMSTNNAPSLSSSSSITGTSASSDRELDDYMPPARRFPEPARCSKEWRKSKRRATPPPPTLASGRKLRRMERRDSESWDDDDEDL
ncbi:hypothetical protein CVT24_008391 [Panaeolus cyanescens]|uniref:Uncharacterized protein n=1 Tax=Panaeolus cyanescens TaxID=181874 RepID=A0A409VL59_9AGAR|nr:hypothetical protein CVT24_008391 [Panaeolus cyanescens]